MIDPKQMTLDDLDVFKTIDNFDCIDAYESEIEPLVRKVKESCQKHRLPMFFAVAVKNTGLNTDYRYEMLNSYVKRSLTDNKIRSLILSMSNFKHDIPDHVKSAINTLDEFLERYENDFTGILLAEDRIADFVDISLGSQIIP